jgi:antitoxin component of MazEF toxin-antitoxin module
MATADIARHLDIKYQHARNVIKDMGDFTHHEARLAGLSEVGMGPGAYPLQPTWLRVGPDGTVQIPAAFLQAAGLKGGGQVVVILGEDGLHLKSQEAALREAQALVRKYVPENVLLSDELIADRRREVVAEESKWKRLEVEAEAAKHG